MEKFIKKYPFDKDDVDTYIVVFVRMVIGYLIVNTVSLFITVAFRPSKMGDCYTDCIAYFEYIYIGLLAAIFIELIPLYFHYRNMNLKKWLGGYVG